MPKRGEQLTNRQPELQGAGARQPPAAPAAGRKKARRKIKAGVSPVPNRALFRVPPLILAALAGAVTVLGFAPFYLFPLRSPRSRCWPCCGSAPAAVAIAALIGSLSASAVFLTGVSWVYVSLHDFGAMPVVLAAFLTLLFCCILALYPAAIGCLYYALGARSALATVVVVPALWTLADWVRGWLFTGFPWIAFGYSQIPASPLAGYVRCSVFTVRLFATAFTLIASSRWPQRMKAEG